MKLFETSLIALSLSCGMPALAESPDAADGASELAVVKVSADALDDEDYQARRASTATRTAAPVIETPQAVNVVSRQLLQDQQAASLDDALANVSGITQTNTLANTWDSFIRRGFGSRDDGSILVDGIRSALPRNFSASTDYVEVLKGPASLLYGIQEPGGVINVITRKPEYTPSGSMALSSSSFGGGSGRFDMTGPIGDSGFAYRVIASAEDSDYWRNFGVTRRKQLAPSLSWRDGTTRVRLSYEYMSYSVPYDRGTVFVNGKPLAIPRERRLDESWSQANGTMQNATASIEHDLGARWRVQANLGWSSLRYNDNQARPVSYNASTGILTRSADGNRAFDDSNLLAMANLLGDVELWGRRHEILLGLDVERDEEAKGTALRGKSTGGFSVYDPVYGLLAEPAVYSASKSNTRTVITSQALLGKDSVHLSERWIAVGGVRLQHYSQEDGGGNPYVVTGRAAGTIALPQLGLVYRVAPAVSLYTSYSESFKPNSSVDSGGPFDPERGVAHEAGIKYEGERISATAAVYRIVKRNVLVTENDVSRSVGRVRSQGVELDVSGRLTRRLSVSASYALTDAKVLEDEADYVGKVPFNVARHTASTFLSYAMPGSGGDRWRFGGGARYVGRRQGDSVNSFSLDPYTLFDLFASWQTRVQGYALELQTTVRNLLDSTYYTSTSGSSLQVNVGTPRELVTQLRLSF